MLRDSCPPEQGTGLGVPVVRAPCAYDDPCIGFRQSAETDYLPHWFLKDGCLEQFLNICGALGVAAPTDVNDPLLTQTSLLFVDNPDTGERCLNTLPPAYSDCVCSDEVPTCDGFVPDGNAGTVVNACSAALCVTWTNLSGWPVCVTPRMVVNCARLAGGPARYEIPFTVNGNDNRTACLIETGGLAGTITPGGDPSHTHGLNLTSQSVGTYSGTVELRPIVVQPGDTIEICADPQVITTGSVDEPFPVTWGDYWLCLDLAAQITPETITQVTGLATDPNDDDDNETGM